MFLCQSWFNVWFVYIAQPVTLMEALWQNGLYCFMSSSFPVLVVCWFSPHDMISEGWSKAFSVEIFEQSITYLYCLIFSKADIGSSV